MVARQVLRVEAQVETLLGLLARRVVTRRGDIRLDAENRLHALLAGLVVERLERKEVAVVRDRKGGHPQFLRLRDKRLDLALPVKERVRRMQVKMDEIGHWGYYTKIRERAPAQPLAVSPSVTFS